MCMPVANQYFLDMTVQLYTWTHSSWDYIHKICTGQKPAKNPYIDGVVAHEIQSLAEELLVTDGCWRMLSWFSSELWLFRGNWCFTDGLSLHTQALALSAHIKLGGKNWGGHDRAIRKKRKYSKFDKNGRYLCTVFSNNNDTWKGVLL